MKRPKIAPVRIPAWAWDIMVWQDNGKHGPRPKAAPARLPVWYWAWRLWRLHGRHEIKPKEFTMYDSVDVEQIPEGAAAVAGYVNGRWSTYPKLSKKFPHAQRLSIAVSAAVDADCLDVEKGDADPWEAAAWVRRQLARGAKRPVVYTSVSQAPLVLKELKRKGITRNQIRLWTADYTFKPHLCSSKCGYDIGGKADATQYTDHALGRNLDASLCSPDFLKENL